MINNKIQAFYNLKKFNKDLEIGKMENLVPDYLRSGIEIFSHQIYASTFALSNPFAKGFILADEVGLGKTMEALLIISQYQKLKSKILVVVPSPTMESWLRNIVIIFNYKCVILDTKEQPCSENYSQSLERYDDGIVLTSYDYLIANADKFKEFDWNLCVLDEAHRFRSYKIKENKTADIVQSVAPNAKKILLTATPIQKNEDGIFGLINFIDDGIFTDYDEFHKRYFRKPENYPELRDLIAPYTFRTLRNQVKLETKLTERQILTQIYEMIDDEKKLYVLLEKYINKTDKKAFPEMQPYELSLMLYGTLSSSAYALSKTLSGIYVRLNKQATNDNEQERHEIKEMLDLSTKIVKNNKDALLVDTLQQTFSTFYRKGIAKKCVIFTGNTQSQEHIHKLLNLETDYNVNSFNGTTDSTPIDKFLRSDKPSVLISTDKGNESLNWQQASFVINYDYPQVLLEMEQRISRCHRIGQLTDVFVLNFICPENFYDVRMYELFYKRMNTSNSIIGNSDSIISGAIDGNIKQNIIDTFDNVRKKKEVQIDFSELSEQFKEEMEDIKAQSNEVLFNTFDQKIVERTLNMGEIIQRKALELNDLVKELAKFYFKNDFIDEDVFGFKTSWHSKNIYAEPFKYSLSGDENYRKFTISSEPCESMLSGLNYTYYLKPSKLTLNSNDKHKGLKGYICCFSVVGKLSYFNALRKTFFICFDENYNILSDKMCDEIMSFDCEQCEEIQISDNIKTFFEKEIEKRKSKIISEMKSEMDVKTKLPLSHINMLAENEKSKLAKEIKDLEKEINAVKNILATDSFAQQLAMNQKINGLSEKLFELKDNEFLAKSKINKNTKQKIEDFMNKNLLSFENSTDFMIYFEVK